MGGRVKVGRNEPCPRGSGRKHKKCCWDKGFTWVRDEEGNVIRQIPLDDEALEAFEDQRRRFREEHGADADRDPAARRADGLLGEDPMSRRDRGSALVAALLLSALLLIMGMASLALRSREIEQVRIGRDGLQAKLLAEMGVEEALVKLSKDLRFPPDLGGRKVFGYSEVLYDAGGRVGSYTVRVDVGDRVEQESAYQDPDFWTLRITSWGHVERQAEVRQAMWVPVATHRIVAELDMSPKDRSKAAAGAESPRTATLESPYYTNPNYFRLIRWEDGTAF